MKLSRSELSLRLLFLVVLGGGLLFWSQLRKPRLCVVELDLTGVLPGELREVDLVVRREGHALARVDLHYGAKGAPGLLTTELNAQPGPAEVEATLLYAKGAARRTRALVRLAEDAPARAHAE